MALLKAAMGKLLWICSPASWANQSRSSLQHTHWRASVPESYADCCHSPIFSYFSAELLFTFPPHIGLTPKLGRWPFPLPRSSGSSLGYSRISATGGVLRTYPAGTGAGNFPEDQGRNAAWPGGNGCYLGSWIVLHAYRCALYGASAFSKHY